MGGKIDKAKGHAKEALGRAVGNERLERSGRRDKAAGHVKEGAARIKESVEKGIDKAKRAIDDQDSRRARR